MRRSELDPADAAELVALDRILAGEPVDASELELAALVESVRADAPRLGRGRRRPPRRAPRQAGRDGVRRASGGAARSAGHPPEDRARVARRRRVGGGGRRRYGRARHRRRRAQFDHDRGGAAGARRLVDPIAPASAAPPRPPRAHRPAAPPHAPAPAVAVPARRRPADASPARACSSARRRSRSATGAASIGQVADEIIAATEQLGGVVQNSNVTEAGNGSLATFSLTVPSASLSELVTTLSRLAHVESLNQSTQDITDSYGRATSRLAADRAERDALFAALARATTPNETTSLDDRIAALDGRIASEQRAVASLRRAGAHRQRGRGAAAGGVGTRADPRRRDAAHRPARRRRRPAGEPRRRARGPGRARAAGHRRARGLVGGAGAPPRAPASGRCSPADRAARRVRCGDGQRRRSRHRTEAGAETPRLRRRAARRAPPVARPPVRAVAVGRVRRDEQPCSGAPGRRRAPRP